MVAEMYLTSRELYVRWCGNITVKTLANWRCDRPGKGPVFRRFGNKILYPISMIEAYERANQYGSTREYDSPRSTKA